MQSPKEVGGYTEGLAAGVTDKGNRRFIGGLAGDADPNEIDSYIEGLAGRLDKGCD